jgi:tRNA A22 N-methylase
VPNVLIIVVAVTIAGVGLLAIAQGLIDEHRRRVSVQYVPMMQPQGLTDEIQEWLQSQ